MIWHCSHSQLPTYTAQSFRLPPYCLIWQFVRLYLIVWQIWYLAWQMSDLRLIINFATVINVIMAMYWLVTIRDKWSSFYPFCCDFSILGYQVASLWESNEDIWASGTTRHLHWYRSWWELADPNCHAIQQVWLDPICWPQSGRQGETSCAKRRSSLRWWKGDFFIIIIILLS